MDIVTEVGYWAAQKFQTPSKMDVFKARRNLGSFVVSRAEDTGVPFVVLSNALCPHTLLEMIDCLREDYLYRVSSDNCCNTIYLTPWENQNFRLWHDMLHVEYGFDTLFEDELELGAHHTMEVIAQFGFDSVEARLIYADTVLNTVFEYKHGRFPESGLVHALSYLNGGE